ncbi:MAG: hypothetical protein WD407_03455 [Rhodospirillales bacterium]
MAANQKHDIRFRLGGNALGNKSTPKPMDYRGLSPAAASGFLQNTAPAQVRLKIGQSFRETIQNNFFLIFSAVPIPPYQHGLLRALQKTNDGFGLRPLPPGAIGGIEPGGR